MQKRRREEAKATADVAKAKALMGRLLQGSFDGGMVDELRELLDAKERAWLETLGAVHSWCDFMKFLEARDPQRETGSEADCAAKPDVTWPLVRTHPITQRKALYLCPGMTTEIVGWDREESAEMLAFLFDWTTKPEFVYSHAWQPGDALMWDNACTMHRRDPFDPAHARLMKRTTILPPADLAVPF